MISGISVYFSAEGKNSLRTPQKRTAFTNDYNLKVDTVSFTGKSTINKLVDETVNLAFEKVQQTKGNPLLRKYLGVTKDNINISIQETDLGKNAILTLSNLNNNGKNYALYELRRFLGQHSKIISLEDLTSKNDEKSIGLIKNILENLK